MRVLVIRLGALGDFVMSFAAFAAIRAQHPAAEITLLTTSPYAGLARAAPWFDQVEIDARPAPWNIAALLRLRPQLRGFDMVYDLQTSGRSSWYFWLAGRPAWSGVARGCSHPQPGGAREGMHTRERQRDQLAHAGISCFPQPDLAFLTSRTLPELPARFALLVPGAAVHRPAKRWPVAAYGALAVALAGRGLTPVVVGAAAERAIGAEIAALCPATINLVERSPILEMFAIAQRAEVAIGNDTGVMHIAAAAGCRCIVLFSADSDPALCAPRALDGTWATVLRVPVLADLSVERVAASLG